MSVVGVTTSANHVPAVVRVDSIYNNVGDSIRVIGVSSEKYSGYNDFIGLLELNLILLLLLSLQTLSLDSLQLVLDLIRLKNLKCI